MEPILVKSRGTFGTRDWVINPNEEKYLPENWQKQPAIVNGLKGEKPFLKIIDSKIEFELREFIQNYNPDGQSYMPKTVHGNTSISLNKIFIKNKIHEKNGKPLTPEDYKSFNMKEERARLISALYTEPEPSNQVNPDSTNNVPDPAEQAKIDAVNCQAEVISDQVTSPITKSSEPQNDAIDTLDVKDADNLLNQNSRTVLTKLKETKLSINDLTLLKKQEEARHIPRANVLKALSNLIIQNGNYQN